MLYIGNNKIIKGYIGNTPITHIGMGNGDLIKIESGGYPENTVAVYTVSGTSAVSPNSVTGKASDWLETCIENGDGTSTMIITASTPPTAINFRSKTTLLSVEFIDTSNMNTMYQMFFDCTNLTSIDPSSWNTSKVTNMSNTFRNCSALTELDISNWNTSSVTNISGIFNGCTKLRTLRLDNCDTATINKIITSANFPTTAISGVTRTIYCKRTNAIGLTAPTNWVFKYID